MASLDSSRPCRCDNDFSNSDVAVTSNYSLFSRIVERILILLEHGTASLRKFRDTLNRVKRWPIE